jgi:hypothetical protein
MDTKQKVYNIPISSSKPGESAVYRREFFKVIACELK